MRVLLLFGQFLLFTGQVNAQRPVGPDYALDGYRLDIPCLEDRELLAGLVNEVAHRLGGKPIGESPAGAWTYSIPRFGGESSHVEVIPVRDSAHCRLELSSALYLPDGVPSGNPVPVSQESMEFFVQAVEQEVAALSGGKAVPFPPFGYGTYFGLALTLPAATPIYVRHKVLLGDGLTMLLAAAYLAVDVAGVAIAAQGGEQAVYGLNLLAATRVATLMLGHWYGRRHESFVATGYGYDPEKRRRFR